MMLNQLRFVLNSDEKTDLRQFIIELRSSDNSGDFSYFLRNQIAHAFAEYCIKQEKPAYFYHASSLGEFIKHVHEMILEEESIWFIVRPKIATQEIYRITTDLTVVETVSIQDLLDLRDRKVHPHHHHQGGVLEIDFEPFYDQSQIIRDPRNIGKGIEFLNRYLAGNLFANPDLWLNSLLKFLRDHQYNGIPLLINDRIQTSTQLSEQVKLALNFLSKQSTDQPYVELRFKLQEMGFEPGWGNTAGTAQQTFELLDKLIESPVIEIERDRIVHGLLEAFISRIPLIFRIVLVSVDGWVAQSGVIGRTDTAGQVVYVIEQAKNLEKQLQLDFKLAGLDLLEIKPQVIVLTRLIPHSEGTLCHQRKEKIDDTENAWILRVPFRECDHKILENWISRLEIWPYLENFAIDAENELISELHGHPELIIGNYSDGNLVAFLLAKKLKSIHCFIAHTLEKPKYLFSNLYWQELESQYHFSLQFTADLIGMNVADFIITSTDQEIVGTHESFGQYESYKSFTMPGLYRVINGIELFSPKFNVIPPGVNEHIFFPYSETENRVSAERDWINDLLFMKEETQQIIGKLADQNKRPILAIAPLNSSKNLTGLAECFGKSIALQEQCNLIIVTHKINPIAASNPEEKNEIEKLQEIIERYHLHDRVRWLGLRLRKPEIGEVYRIIGDRGGIFVNAAKFEAFGLTVLEAMISGLPTFATQFGGPLEIIQDGENGFHINPTDLEGTATKILDFFERCDNNSHYWDQISERAIKRVRDKYNWHNHSKQLLLLAKIYSFWHDAAKPNREALRRYVEALFYLIYQPRATQMLMSHCQK